MKRLLLVLVLTMMATGTDAKTLLLQGRIDSEVTIREQVTFAIEQPVSGLTYRFPLPADLDIPGLSQKTSDKAALFNIEPSVSREEIDKYGNRFRVLKWEKLHEDLRGEISYKATITAELRPVKLMAPFPPDSAPGAVELYLKPTRLVQSDNPAIITRAKALTGSAGSQQEAVEAILNFVTDHIIYETPPRTYDALYALESRNGNCQNFAHLAIALLRAAGIPSRVAVGLTLKDKWKVPADDKGSSIVQGMGQGLHAWMEIWFPGSGWLPYDPQQSKQFTSTRHIKYAHGPECSNLSPSWVASPVLPKFTSVISSSYSRDIVDLKLVGSGISPRGYMLGNKVFEERFPDVSKPLPPPVSVPKPVAEPLPPPAKPPVLPSKPVKKDDDSLVVFGNPRLPENMTMQIISGNRGEAALERETAEYVTSSGIYAQAFVVERPMRLVSISLGMKKFGGDGDVYLDVVADDNGKPGLARGIRTRPISLEKVRRLPGYGWLEFPLYADAEPFKPGKYWIVFRRSGEAVMNWYYTPGKPYGGPDDTRSTSKGWQWEDILMYDFVFKVTGRLEG